VSGLLGGAADKLGNRYEHFWVATCIVDLLEGEATRLRLEPPGSVGRGIELEIDRSGITWGDQAKDHATPWTTRRLLTEGVLSDIQRQAGMGRSFRFVTSSPAVDLDWLSKHARKLSFDEFKAEMSAKSEAAFEDMARHWEATREEAWLLLQGVLVETYSLIAPRAHRSHGLQDHLRRRPGRGH